MKAAGYFVLHMAYRLYLAIHPTFNPKPAVQPASRAYTLSPGRGQGTYCRWTYGKQALQSSRQDPLLLLPNVHATNPRLYLTFPKLCGCGTLSWIPT